MRGLGGTISPASKAVAFVWVGLMWLLVVFPPGSVPGVPLASRVRFPIWSERWHSAFSVDAVSRYQVEAALGPAEARRIQTEAAEAAFPDTRSAFRALYVSAQTERPVTGQATSGDRSRPRHGDFFCDVQRSAVSRAMIEDSSSPSTQRTPVDGDELAWARAWEDLARRLTDEDLRRLTEKWKPPSYAVAWSQRNRIPISGIDRRLVLTHGVVISVVAAGLAGVLHVLGVGIRSED